MGGIASGGQLRMSFLRWAAVTVPAILLLGFLSARSVPVGSENAWYRALAKPAINPPDWVFPVTWTILYVMIGFALAMVLNARRAKGRGVAVALFAAQLALNLIWTPLFFGAHQVTAALLDIVAMLLLAVAATVAFARIRAAAAWLMVPYLVWISFAGVLTWRIGQMTPDAAALVPRETTSQVIG